MIKYRNLIILLLFITKLIDTLENVALSRKKGPEEDILGYRAFRSNFKSEEFGHITNATVEDTLFTKQIKLNNLSKKIYCRIATIDRNFDQSKLSEVVLLVNPNILPPTSPLFKFPKSEKEGVVLEWINSLSKDVAKHVLYRRKAGKENWKTITIFLIIDSINTFTDNQIQAKLLFEYTLLVVGSTNNESKPCKSVFAHKIDGGIKPAIENWDHPYADVKHFIVYRVANNSPLQYFKIVRRSLSKMTDQNIEINTTYKYRIKTLFSDGSESSFSKGFEAIKKSKIN